MAPPWAGKIAAAELAGKCAAAERTGEVVPRVLEGFVRIN
jgi:hypothetical protein